MLKILHKVRHYVLLSCGFIFVSNLYYSCMLWCWGDCSRSCMSQTTHSCVFIVYVTFVNSTFERGYKTGDNNVGG